MKRIGGAITIYFGISCLLVAIASFVALGVTIYKAVSGDNPFSYGTIITIALIAFVMGALGYILTRIGLNDPGDS